MLRNVSGCQAIVENVVKSCWVVVACLGVARLKSLGSGLSFNGRYPVIYEYEYARPVTSPAVAPRSIITRPAAVAAATSSSISAPQMCRRHQSTGQLIADCRL